MIAPVRVLEMLRRDVRVEVSPMLPFESTNPEKPGWVHAVKVPEAVGLGSVLLMSQALFDSLKAHDPERDRKFRAKARWWFR